MKNKRELTRELIIQALIDALEPLPHVHAVWEGGAVAFGRVDKWSDIDLYVVVDDDKIDNTFLAVEKALKLLSPIKQKYIPQTQWPGVSQAFYRLKNTSEYLLIDLAILKRDSPEMFLEPEIHGSNVFYFNKGNQIRTPHVDKIALISKLVERRERLEKRFNLFSIFIQKEIDRGNVLEALDLYYNLMIGLLVEALRMKYNPYHYDFKMRYIHYELPSDVIERLKRLCFVKDEEDLKEKYDRATKWFRQALSEVNKEKIVKTLERPTRIKGRRKAPLPRSETAC